MMGPISGDMSIAPMITAVELTFSPSEAMKIAVIRIHRLAPRKEMPLVISETIYCFSSRSGRMLK